MSRLSVFLILGLNIILIISVIHFTFLKYYQQCSQVIRPIEVEINSIHSSTNDQPFYRSTLPTLSNYRPQVNNRVLKNLKSTTCSQSLNELALLSPGLSELNQYKNAINITEIALNDTNKNFDKIKSGLTYIVSLLHSEGSNCFSFLVQERRKLNLRTTNGRLGGSGFHALAKGNNTVAYCPYVDHFNDSYSIYCPLIETCVAVSIHVIYFDYLAYTRKVIAHFPLNKLIFSGVICDAATHQQQFFPYPSLHWKKRASYKRVSLLGNCSENMKI